MQVGTPARHWDDSFRELMETQVQPCSQDEEAPPVNDESEASYWAKLQLIQEAFEEITPGEAASDVGQSLSLLQSLQPGTKTPDSIVKDLPWGSTAVHQAKSLQAQYETPVGSKRALHTVTSAKFHGIRRGEADNQTAMPIREALAVNKQLVDRGPSTLTVRGTTVTFSADQVSQTERALRQAMAGLSYAEWFVGMVHKQLSSIAAEAAARKSSTTGKKTVDSMSILLDHYRTANTFLASLDKALTFSSQNVIGQLASFIRHRRNPVVDLLKTKLHLRPDEQERLKTQGLSDAILGKQPSLFAQEPVQQVLARFDKEQAAKHTVVIQGLPQIARVVSSTAKIVKPAPRATPQQDKKVQMSAPKAPIVKKGEGSRYKRQDKGKRFNSSRQGGSAPKRQP